MENNIISNSIKTIKRNKSNWYIIAIITLLLTLSFLCITFRLNFDKYNEYLENRNIEFRTFYVYHENNSNEKSIQELKKVDHILEVYNPNYASRAIYSNINLHNLDGSLVIRYGTQNLVPISIEGKSIEDLDTNEMICPYNFYPDSSIYEFNIDKNKIIHKDESINLIVSLKLPIYNNDTNSKDKYNDITYYTRNFKIVGLYDNTINMNDNNECYIKAEDMIEIVNKSNTVTNQNEYTNLLVAVDKIQNIEAVREQLINLGYEVNEETRVYIDKNLINTVKIISNIIIIVVIISSFLILKNYIYKKIRNEKKYLGILRACGYTKNQIIICQSLELLTELIISFIISILTEIIVFIILKNYIFNKYTYIGLDISNNILYFIMFFSIIIVLSFLIDSIQIRKIINNSISYILNENLNKSEKKSNMNIIKKVGLFSIIFIITFILLCLINIILKK